MFLKFFNVVLGMTSSFIAWKKLRRDKGGGSPTRFSHEKSSEGRSRRNTTSARRGGKVAQKGNKTTKCETRIQKKSTEATLNSYMRWFATAHFSSACAFRVHFPNLLPPPRARVTMHSRPRHQTSSLTVRHHAPPPSCRLSSVFFVFCLSFFLCSVFHRLRQVLFVCCRQRLQGAAVGWRYYFGVFGFCVLCSLLCFCCRVSSSASAST